MTGAQIFVFRSYPAPGQSWRSWTIDLDGKRSCAIGGGGSCVISTSPGVHELRVQSGHLVSESLTIDATERQPIAVLAKGVPVQQDAQIVAITMTVVQSMEGLPRSCVPLFAPGGRTQSLAEGRRRAVLAGAILAVFSLVLIGAGIAALAVIRRQSGLPDENAAHAGPAPPVGRSPPADRASRAAPLPRGPRASEFRRLSQEMTQGVSFVFQGFAAFHPELRGVAATFVANLRAASAAGVPAAHSVGQFRRREKSPASESSTRPRRTQPGAAHPRRRRSS